MADLYSSSPRLQLGYAAQRARLWKWHQSITVLGTVKSCQISDSPGALWRCICRLAHKLRPLRVGNVQKGRKKKKKKKGEEETCTAEQWEHVEGGEFIGFLRLENWAASHLPDTNKFILTLPVWVDCTATAHFSCSWIHPHVSSRVY